MNRSQYDARVRFESLIKDEAEPNQTGMETHERRMNAARLASLLLRHAKTHARIQEMVCNGVEWTQYDTNETFNRRQARHEAWTEKRDRQIEARITAICAELGPGFKPVFSGDPRGCTVKIAVPSGKTDDMGREGICVPTFE